MNNQPPTNRDKLEETVYSHIEGAYHNGHFDARWSAKEDDEVQRFRVDQIMAEVEAYTEEQVKRILRDKKQTRHYTKKLTEEEKLAHRRMDALPWSVVHCNRCNKAVAGPSQFTVFLGATEKDDYSAHTDCLTEEELAKLRLPEGGTS